MSTSKEKVALRKEIASRLSKLTSEEKLRQSKIVYNKLINLPVWNSSKRVSIYLSTPYEIDTEQLVGSIFQEGKKCFVPRYSKDGMDMVRLKSMKDWENLPMTKWKIKQPSLKEVREDAMKTGGLDLMICPGVAFTKNGDRMGHGGGYYDSYLAMLKQMQENPPTTVGLAFKEQILDSVPLNPEDVTMDSVLFPE